jgi:hypothetical protein
LKHECEKYNVNVKQKSPTLNWAGDFYETYNLSTYSSEGYPLKNVCSVVLSFIILIIPLSFNINVGK